MTSPGPRSGVLELWLEPPGTLDRVALELKVAQRRVREPLRQAAAVLGLPDPLEHGRAGGGGAPGSRLDPVVLEQLAAAVREQDLATLWLRFGSPAGYLPVVPWERLLAPALGVAVLRLPYFELPPVTPRDTLTIALCASAPRAKGVWPVPELVDLCIQASVTARAGRVAIEVFAGDDDAEPIRERVERLGAGRAGGAAPGITVHPPEGAARFGVAGRSSGVPSAQGNPWLDWMAAELDGRSVDVAHFVCPGYLSAGQGALALAESPLQNIDHAWARFVGVTQLAAFARRVGAWALHLTAPLPDRWVTGLRLLADQMARQRPGPVLLHESAGRPAALDELSAAYTLLYGTEDEPVRRPGGFPRSGALVLYCNSGLLAGARDWEEMASPAVLEAMDKHTLAGGQAGAAIESPEPTPGWLASNQRYLEQCTGQLLADQPPAAGTYEFEEERAAAPGDDQREAVERAATEREAARQGAQDALALVAKAIEDYQQGEGEAR